MKKIFFVLFMTLLALPAFSFGFQTDAYFGSSSGFDAELVFGNGKYKEEVKRHGLEVLAEIPIDPELATKVDQGKVEEYETDALDELVHRVEEYKK